MPATSTLLRRERLVASGLFDESVRTGEDHEFHLATCRAGRVAFVDVPTILYQVGAADALTHAEFNVPMARHYLSTLTRALSRDRSRIQVPQRVIDEVVADAHRWLGETLLRSDERGEKREGRAHLLRSLRIAPRQPRVVSLYAAGFLPAGLRERLIETYREVKQRLR
jgi:hypothetical protein